MKAGIHPEANLCTVTCTCGNTFNIISEKEKMSVDLCSNCHPYYTGQQKFVDTAGRVDRFAQRYALKTDDLQKLAQVKHEKAKKTKLAHQFNPKKKAVEAPRKGEEGAEAKAEGGKPAKA